MNNKPLLLYHGLFVEVDNENEFWGNDTIYIYDGLSDSTEKEIIAITNYLYDEGFIQDRRTKCTILRGENFD